MEGTRRVGELASATGLTVRTLHHWEAAGLLVPARSEAGHRLYGPEHVRRVYRVVALRRELGDERISGYEQEWTELIARAEEHRARGDDPAGPEMQAVAACWRELIEAFTGGDAGIRDTLARMVREEGAEHASRGAVSGELIAYFGRALSTGA